MCACVCVYAGVYLRVGERARAFVNWDGVLGARAQPRVIIRMQTLCKFAD